MTGQILKNFGIAVWGRTPYNFNEPYHMEGKQNNMKTLMEIYKDSSNMHRVTKEDFMNMTFSGFKNRIESQEHPEMADDYDKLYGAERHNAIQNNKALQLQYNGLKWPHYVTGPEKMDIRTSPPRHPAYIVSYIKTREAGFNHHVAMIVMIKGVTQAAFDLIKKLYIGNIN